jgi:hypothetical protein
MPQTKTAKKDVPTEVLELLARMGVEEPDSFECGTVECGLHSGFPPCCIAFLALPASWPGGSLTSRAAPAGERRSTHKSRREVAQKVVSGALWCVKGRVGLNEGGSPRSATGDSGLNSQAPHRSFSIPPGSLAFASSEHRRENRRPYRERPGQPWRDQPNT